MMFTTRKSLDYKYQSLQQFNNSLSTPFKSKMAATSSTSNGFPRLTMSAQSSRSSSSSFKNTKGKLQILQNNLSLIKDQIQCIKQQTKDTKQFQQFIAEELIQRKLPQIQVNLIQQIRKLSKQVKINQVSSQSRFDAIKEDISQLNQSSKNIQKMLNTLKIKLNQVQHTMGFYSGSQKHRY